MGLFRLIFALPKHDKKVVPTVREAAAGLKDVSPDVLDAYLHRIEAYATMIVVGSLIFGFAATTSIPAAREGSDLDAIRQNVETCLLMGTLATASFTVVVSSTIVYHSLKIASAVGLAAFSLPEAQRSTEHNHNLRIPFDRYTKNSGHLRGWARVMLALSFVLYLLAIGADKASSVSLASGIIIGFTLLGGTVITWLGVRALSYEYRKSSNDLKKTRAQYENALVGKGPDFVPDAEDTLMCSAVANRPSHPGDSSDAVIEVGQGVPASPGS